MNTDTNTLIIDLASLPGGVDFDTAENSEFMPLGHCRSPENVLRKRQEKL